MRWPRVEALFAGASTAYEKLVDADERGFLLCHAERMLSEADPLSVSGREKLALDCGGDVQKFKNLLAELRFAMLFAGLGARVELLRDRAFGGGSAYTPDLRVEFPGGLITLVDVTSWSSGMPEIYGPLDAGLTSRGLMLQVDSLCGPGLSRPVLDGRGRTQVESLVDNAVEAALERMESVTLLGESTGMVHVIRAADASLRSELHAHPVGSWPSQRDVPLRHNEEWIGTFFFRPSPMGRGFAGGSARVAHVVDVATHTEKVIRDLERKAERQTRLPKELQTTPFLVAVDVREFSRGPEVVLAALTGARCCWGGSEDQRSAWLADAAPHPIEVELAMRKGWGVLVELWDYGPKAELRFTDYGAYLKEAWAGHLSGVLFLHSAPAVVQWLPNPFAIPPLNEPRLLDVGLPLAALGEESGLHRLGESPPL